MNEPSLPPSAAKGSLPAALEDLSRLLVAGVDAPPAFMLPVTGFLPRKRRSLRDLSPSQRRPLRRDGRNVGSASRMVAEGRLSSAELVQDSIQAIARRNSHLNAFVSMAPEPDLMAQAAKLDAERVVGKVRGPLHGIPITVSDGIYVEGMPSTASSSVLAGVKAYQDAVAVRLLKRAGAIILGKTQTHEFGLDVVTPQSRNPWDASREPGGASGGSAIAVATGMGLASLGADTRGSIRLPAALCGVVGFKPTFGLVPTAGSITLSWSLDHVAPMTVSVEDAALLLNALAIGGPLGGAQVPRRKRDFTTYLHKDVRGLRLAVPNPALDGAEAPVMTAFQSAVAGFKESGVDVVETGSPTDEEFHLASSMSLLISRCEAVAFHWRFQQNRGRYSQQAAEQLEAAAKVTAADYVQAQRYRAEFRMRTLEHLEKFDGFLMPTCPIVAPHSKDAGQYLTVLSRNCAPWSFIGFPAVSVPMGFTSDGLPVGVQLVAAPLEDGRLLAIAAALEGSLAG